MPSSDQNAGRVQEALVSVLICSAVSIERDQRLIGAYVEVQVSLEVPRVVFGILPCGIVLVETEWRRSILKAFQSTLATGTLKKTKGSPFPSDEITHCPHGEVNHVVHATGVNALNKLSPVINSSPVGVESCKI